MDFLKMGQVGRLKVFVVVFCLLLASLVIYQVPEPVATQPKVPLKDVVSNVRQWTLIASSPLGSPIIESLKLDDYVNNTYVSREGRVSLYIGYYTSQEDVGAAHSPLVCYPGQGWQLSGGRNASAAIGSYRIHFRQMIAAQGGRKELVIYWFQAYDKTSPGTFMQKIHALWAKYRHSASCNAFVRIIVPLKGISPERAMHIGKKFMQDFYPLFLGYMVKAA